MKWDYADPDTSCHLGDAKVDDDTGADLFHHKNYL